MLLVVILTTLLTILITPLVWWYLKLAKFNSLNSIPGPTPLPIIGNDRQIGKTTVDLLHSFTDLMQTYGNVFKVWLGPRLHLILTKPETVEFFLNSHQHLGKSNGYDLFKPWLGDGLLVSTGAKWKSRRKMITPTFHFTILEQFLANSFNKHINILLDVLNREAQTNKDYSVELQSLVNLCSLDIICETAFGTELNAQNKGNPKYVEAVNGFLEIFTLRFFSGWLRSPLIFRFNKMYPRYQSYLKIMHNFTNTIIKKRKEEFELMERKKHDDDDLGIKKRAALLDMLLEASDNGKYLSDEDIREEVDTFMFEGYDTAASSICFALYALAQNPQIQAKVYDEIISTIGSDWKQDLTMHQIQDLKYFDVVIKEVLRIYPPVPLIERSLDSNCIIDGLTIPKETNISIFLYGMNHNPETFPNPEIFDPDRFLSENLSNRHNFAYVPFSAGPRNCIGQKYAMLELKSAVVKILQRFHVEENKDKPAQIGMCSVLKSRNGIYVKLRART